MAHWFHRNPLKATAYVGFELNSALTGSEASKICSELRLRRDIVLQFLKDSNNEVDIVEDAFYEYLAILNGFLFAVNDVKDESKLRRLVRFCWTDSMLGMTPNELNDCWFEALNVIVNMGLWYMKHGAKTAGVDQVNEIQAKEVHTCLRKAAGIFLFVRNCAGKHCEAIETGSDMDEKVLNAYINQCTGEAQEITIARAIELKHAPGLISGLSKETADLFFSADKSLQSLDGAVFDKWRRYCQLKGQFYMAYAYAFLGEYLLSVDKCGQAVRACREGQSCYKNAEEFCKEYREARGPGVRAQPEKHLFFRHLQPILKRHLDKAERENGFIYHEKVPEECPELTEKTTYGLVKPQEFSIPPAHAQLWNPHVYQSFDITKAKMPDFSKTKKSEKKLPPVKEVPIYQTDKDPNNSSGCVLS